MRVEGVGGGGKEACRRARQTCSSTTDLRSGSALAGSELRYDVSGASVRHTKRLAGAWDITCTHVVGERRRMVSDPRCTHTDKQAHRYRCMSTLTLTHRHRHRHTQTQTHTMLTSGFASSARRMPLHLHSITPPFASNSTSNLTGCQSTWP